MVTLSGKDGHKRRLRTLSKEAVTVAGRVVYVGADMVRAEAFQSISRGSVSGAGHIPSVPGEPPNRDSGILQAGLEIARTGPVQAQVSSNAQYSAALEFGTGRMSARPYMRPARDKTLPEINRLFVTEMDKFIKRSG